MWRRPHPHLGVAKILNTASDLRPPGRTGPPALLPAGIMQEHLYTLRRHADLCGINRIHLNSVTNLHGTDQLDELSDRPNFMSLILIAAPVLQMGMKI